MCNDSIYLLWNKCDNCLNIGTVIRNAMVVISLGEVVQSSAKSPNSKSGVSNSELIGAQKKSM